MRLLDLREFVRPDFAVTLPNGEEYALPGDIDTERMLWFLDLQQRFEDATDEQAVEILRDMRDKTLDLFRIRDPDIEWADLGLSVEQMSLLFAKLVSAYNQTDEGAGDAGPPTKAKGRATRRSPKNSPRSASSRKSKASTGRTS